MPLFTDYPSRNCGPRRLGALPDLIVLHYTAMATADAACVRLCDPEVEVSAHYLIDETGKVIALVPEELRAWHAGAGAWGAVSDVNSRSIGIELANTGDGPFADSQMVALLDLLGDVMHRWAIPAQRVIGHSDMAPGRKGDPGAWFDWQRLAAAGLSVWPEDAEPGDFYADARAFGYPDVGLDLLLSAFRLRFRPDATGPLDAQDAAMAHDLALRFPVDASGAGA